MENLLLELRDAVVLRHTDPTGPLGLWGAKPVRAVDGVSLSLRRGETLGIIGGGGAGKSTLAEAVTLRRPLDRGRLLIEGRDVTNIRGDERRRLQRRLGLIRQDARDSLDLEQTVRRQFSELLRRQGMPVSDDRLAVALERVELPPEFLDRTPLEMSGGEQQRVAIARALLTRPVLVAADEPVAGVDPRLKDVLIRLFQRVQRESNMSYLVISQEFLVIRRMAHRVAVMHEGRLYEIGPVDRIFGEAKHPYSRFFLGLDPAPSVPPEEDRAGREIRGCPWAAYCPVAGQRCRQERPVLAELSPGHAVACHAV
ncbi:MAG TPA: ATP-binding cassette domain-containing protein [Symbiobacteriaceae bacterium]